MLCILKVPNLRFPGFEGEWEAKKLGEIARFSKGKGISKAEIEENGKTECIRYGELYTTYNEIIDTVISKTNTELNKLILSEENDIIIPASGETQIDIATASCLMKSGVALGGDLNIIKTPLNGIFLSYYLNSKKKIEIANLAQGISVVHLYSSQLSTLEINYPLLQEQSKIAGFLSLCETRIQQSSKIIEGLKSFKSATSKKIFSQELRFKDDNGEDFAEWEEKTLRDCLNYEQPTNYLVASTEYENKFETPVVTAGKTFILGYTNETTGIFDKNLPVIIFDDFTTSTQFVSFPFKAKSSAMKILKAKKGLNIRFVYEAMQMINYEIGGHGRHWISVFEKLEILIPSIPEQTKIANFLSGIDEKIDLETSLLQQLKLQKQYLLQQMFM